MRRKSKKSTWGIITFACCFLPVIWLSVAGFRGESYYKSSLYCELMQKEREKFQQAFQTVRRINRDTGQSELDPTKGPGSYSDEAAAQLVSGRDEVNSLMSQSLRDTGHSVYVMQDSWLSVEQTTQTPEPDVFIFW